MPLANQQFDSAAIEAVVREVLRRVQELRRRSGVGTPAPTHSTFPSPIQNSCPSQIQTPTNTPCPTRRALTNSAQPVETQAHVFECNSKVISMQTLRGHLDNVTTIRVKPKTIVTPAVRDELRARKIQIAFDLGATCKSGNVPAKILLGTTCNSTGNNLRDQLKASGTQVQLHVEKSAAQLATKVGNKISPSMPAVIVADHPYSAACSANRNSRVRAVVIGDPNELRAAKDELNPNCVIIKSGNEGRFNLSYVLSQLT